jgi:hypothetical protein
MKSMVLAKISVSNGKFIPCIMQDSEFVAGTAKTFLVPFKFEKINRMFRMNIVFKGEWLKFFDMHFPKMADHLTSGHIHQNPA